MTTDTGVICAFIAQFYDFRMQQNRLIATICHLVGSHKEAVETVILMRNMISPGGYGGKPVKSLLSFNIEQIKYYINYSIIEIV